MINPNTEHNFAKLSCQDRINSFSRLTISYTLRGISSPPTVDPILRWTVDEGQ